MKLERTANLLAVALLALGLPAWGQDSDEQARFIAELIQELDDEDAATRLWAAESLGEFGSASAPAVPALALTLQDPDSDVRVYTAKTLGKIGPLAASAVPALAVALQDPQATVRVEALKALGRIGPPAAEALRWPKPAAAILTRAFVRRPSRPWESSDPWPCLR